MATKKPPAEKVLEAGVERDDEKFLYYLDKRGNVMRMERGVARAKTEVILKTGLKREKGFMYYLDDNGDICREVDNSRG